MFQPARCCRQAAEPPDCRGTRPNGLLWQVLDRRLPRGRNQFQNLFTILGHYDYQFSPANHFSVRSYFTRNHTNGFSGAQGQNEIPQAFDNTENFTNKGGAVVFSLNTVLGRKVNEVRISVADEVRERHANSDSPGLSISGIRASRA